MSNTILMDILKEQQLASRLMIDVHKAVNDNHAVSSRSLDEIHSSVGQAEENVKDWMRALEERLESYTNGLPLLKRIKRWLILCWKRRVNTQCKKGFLLLSTKFWIGN
jgi:hypothetical protein